MYFAKRESLAALGPSDEVLVPDLGSDRVWRILRSAGGKWEKKSDIIYDRHSGGGPRHVVVRGRLSSVGLPLLLERETDSTVLSP